MAKAGEASRKPATRYICAAVREVANKHFTSAFLECYESQLGYFLHFASKGRESF